MRKAAFSCHVGHPIRAFSDVYIPLRGRTYDVDVVAWIDDIERKGEERKGVNFLRSRTLDVP